MHEQRGNFCIFLLKIAEKEGKTGLSEQEKGTSKHIKDNAKVSSNTTTDSKNNGNQRKTAKASSGRTFSFRSKDNCIEPGLEMVPCVATLSASIIVRGQHCSTSVFDRHMLLFSAHHGSAAASTSSPAALRHIAVVTHRQSVR